MHYFTKLEGLVIEDEWSVYNHATLLSMRNKGRLWLGRSSSYYHGKTKGILCR